MLLALAMLANIAAVVPTGTAAYAQQGTGSYTMEHLGRDDLLKKRHLFDRFLHLFFYCFMLR